MGTRADFYVGRGKDAEWIGSLAFDGPPSEMPRALITATRPGRYREAVAARLLDSEDSSSRPEDGWPWPWDDSNTSDFAYCFDRGRVYFSCFGRPWRLATGYGRTPQSYYDRPGGGLELPNMKARRMKKAGR